MATEQEVKSIMYRFIEASELAMEVTGEVSKRLRNPSSEKEDVIITIENDERGDIQDFFVLVNVFIADVQIDSTYYEDTARIGFIEKLCEELFESQTGDGYRFDLLSQMSLPVEDKNEHRIKNRILFKHLN